MRRIKDKYHLMESFCCVVEQKSFAKAAHVLGLPASSVSKSITKLEQDLDQALLIRTTRSMSLTDIGAVYYERGKRLIQQWNELEQEVRDSKDSPNGQLKISLPKAIGQQVFSTLINEFMAQYPNMSVELDFSHQPINLIEDDYDIAIRTWKHLPNSGLYKLDLLPLNPILVASKEYVLTHGRPVNINELNSHKLLSFQRADKRIKKWIIDETEIALNNHYASNDYENLLKACKAGIGIANVYSLLAKASLERGELVQILPDCEQQNSQLSILYKQSRESSTKLNCFLAFIEKAFQ